MWSSAALADLDGNPDLEVVMGSTDGVVHVWHSDGSPAVGWPATTGAWVSSSAALGDLDGDGDLEVVVGSQDHNVYAWHANGTAVTGWPQATGAYVDASPALADLDGDGWPEVIVGSGDGSVYAWHGDGVPLAGWPQMTGASVGTPCVGDLDSDGDPEIVAFSADMNAYAWHADGTPVAGWPRPTGSLAGTSPALADLDGDGDLEVVLGSGDHHVYAWHGDGTPVAGWPLSVGDPVYGGATVGDIDGDGQPEVVVGAGNDVYAWHANGASVAGWPQPTGDSVESPPALGDLDGDGGLEVVVGSYDHRVYAWHGNGTTVAGWPQLTGNVVISSAAIGDIDGDGDVEVVVGSRDGKVYAWSCDTPTADLLAWPTFRHDAQRSGCYGGPQQPPITRGGLSGQVRIAGTTTNIAGATVEAYLGDELKGSGVTDASGIYAIHGLPAGEYVVVARKPNYEDQAKSGIVVVAGETTYVNFNLNAFCTITGQVRVRGTTTNIPGATITAYLDGEPVATTTTDGLGLYVIETTNPSPAYVVSAAKAGYQTQTKGPVSVALGQTTYVNFNLIIPSLKGQVKDGTAGTPLVGATVKAFEAGFFVAGTSTMPRYGIYEFGAELPPDMYNITASMRGYVRQTRWNITLTGGVVSYVNFSLQRSGTLTGQVKDAISGDNIVGAVVRAHKDGMVWATATTTAPYGVYEMDSDLPAGTYNLDARKPGSNYLPQVKSASVTAGATTYVNFNLQPQ